MNHRVRPYIIVTALWIFGSACSAPMGGGPGGSGGDQTGGSGGRTTGQGGSTPNGGKTGSGGAAGEGGGGIVGTGGGEGGSTSNGGKTGSGGAAGKGVGGIVGTGGASGAGGNASGGGGGVGGSTAPTTSACSGTSAGSGDVTVDLSSLRQKISGFGASTAWSSTMSASDADLLWSTTTGAGLSLHRIRIDPTGTGTSETDIAKLAVARGVTVWATPWTPPSADKTGETKPNVMGTLSNGQDFASKLATFVANMKNAGVPIYAISAQNEPDANVDYESCVYTPASMTSFVGTYMGPALANSGVKIMAPETQNWCGFQNFEPVLMADAKAMSYISIVATHEYGCSVKAYPDIAKAGKEFWETEVFDSNGGSQGIDSGLRVAKLIHDALTIANMNAWHYWWVYTTGGANGLWDKAANKPSKRLWVMGNYSRFARPGYLRVGTTGSVPSNVLLTAYKNPVDGTVVVVAANTGNSAASLSAFISGAAPCTLTPYVTSSTEDLASKPVVSVSAGRFTVSLPAQTATTFVGKP